MELVHATGKKFILDVIQGQVWTREDQEAEAAKQGKPNAHQANACRTS
jgi:hypothetical protein